MPRNRTAARLAVLGSSVQRPSSAGYSSRAATALRRRIVAGVLVVLSLALITVYFRESSGGPLHDLQNGAASVLRPFEVGAERVSRPFRDAYGWLADLVGAKSENDRLRAELDSLRQQLIQNESALKQNEVLRALLAYRDGPSFPRDYRGVAAAVLSRTPIQFEQQITIAAGRSAGVRVSDPVITQDGLVGQVTKTTRGTALVTLLTDDSSAVSAVDLRTGAGGILRHGAGAGDALILDRVTKDLVVQRGEVVITAGSQLGKLPSIYPRGIPIGRVTSVGQTDTDLFKQVQVAPFVRFSSLDAVLVLVPTRPIPKLP